jgi:cation:H+ antiporter
MLYSTLPAQFLVFAVGVALLIRGSNWFIDGAVYVARRYNISEVIIGITLVSLGTSLPELAASLYAAMIGSGSICLGNVVGSNITNIALIIGVTAVIAPKIELAPIMIKRDGSLMVAFMIGFYLLMFINIGGHDRVIYLPHALILLLLFSGYMFWLFKNRKADLVEQQSHKDEAVKFKSIVTASLAIVSGGIFISGGSKLMIDSAIFIAKSCHVSESVIGVTVVALGTSLPELAVTAVAAVKGRFDMSVGNIIGSNIFNALFIVGCAGLVAPLKIESVLLMVHIPTMLFICLLFLLMTLRNYRLSRFNGLLLLIIYVGFLVFNYV